ncbi:MAG: hypothetical protein ABEN55_05710 [Bradymonadaceae bacterium]
MGDILKHGALVRLARVAAQRAIRGPVTYIETHAYLLDSPWNNPLKWKQNINTQLAKHPAYTDYVRMEKDRLDADEPYRCSTGLALDIISERSYHAIFAETDDETRRKLKSQVRQDGFRADFILEDLSELQEIEPPRGEDEDEDDPAGGSTLVLVDPFELDDDTWQQVVDGLDEFIEEESEGMILVFDFDADNDELDWPDPPPHFLGPVATLDHKPYHLAGYATDAMTGKMLDELDNLGWNILYEQEED